METTNIKKVAIYLRKSRDKMEEEDVLWKHRLMLTEYAKKNKWEYKIFEEPIMSGERLTERIEINKMLEEVKQNKFDGVLVMDYDRLSRGGLGDFGIIEKIFEYTNTNIISLDKTYNFNNDGDSAMLSIKSVFANIELKAITKRFQNAKRAGATNGKFVNGEPPFPYYINRLVCIDNNGKQKVNNTIEVNPEQLKTYNKIKEMYLSNNYTIAEIVYYLNNNGIKPPRATTWGSKTVHRLLIHNFHMGIVTYGKYAWKKDLEGKRNPKNLRNESEWYVGQGVWQKLKTEEEHREILNIMDNNRRVPSRTKHKTHALSGLMYCKLCGHAMSFSISKPLKSGEKVVYVRCYYTDAYGNKCPQKAFKLKENFYDDVYDIVINSYLNSEILVETQASQDKITEKKTELQQFKKEMDKQETGLRRIKDAYISEALNLKEFGEEKKKVDDKINKIKEEINKAEDYIFNSTKYTKKELENKIKLFKHNWKRVKTEVDRNNLLKSVVKRFIYNRTPEDIILEIEYL